MFAGFGIIRRLLPLIYAVDPHFANTQVKESIRRDGYGEDNQSTAHLELGYLAIKNGVLTDFIQQIKARHFDAVFPN
jgi:hypothetical protein